MIKLIFVLIFSFENLYSETLLREKVIMGTFCSVTLLEEDKKHFSKIFTLLHKVDEALSSFSKNSPIYKLNQKKEAFLGLYSYEALFLSQKYYTDTDAYFNIAVGKITKDLYRFGMDESLASLSQLQEANTSLSSLTFTTRSAILTNGVKIDLGGMGKGFSLDKVSNYLKSNSVRYAIIALSGDIRCIKSCKIAVNNPFSKQPLVSFTTTQKDTGISTSGNYNRYVKTTQDNHLINPKTNKSAHDFISITLIGRGLSSELDAYATAVSVMPRKKAYSFLQTKDIAFIILQENQKLIVSQNIEQYVKDLIIHYTAK